MMKKMKKRIALVMGALLCISMAGCTGSAKAPDSIRLASEGYVFRQAGETYNLREDIQLEGENVSEDLVFSSTDPAVAEVSKDGVLTAAGTGSAKITVTSAVDEKVSASADILVYDYTGTYTGEKFIDAMGCNIRVSFVLSEDGTFQYYRYPMYVTLQGGGQMEGLNDKGTYQVQGNKIEFTADFLSTFSLSLTLGKDGAVQLSGDTPTGGATTEMEFSRTSTEDQGETGTYAGTGERENGEEISYQLTLENGSYTLVSIGADGVETALSSGNYSFAEQEIEFFAGEGITFHASYDVDRQVIEGTGIPVSAEEEVAVTLTKQG